MKKYKGLKHKKHNKIVNDNDKQKEKHLEKLATKMLKNDEKSEKLKTKQTECVILTNDISLTTQILKRISHSSSC